MATSPLECAVMTKETVTEYVLPMLTSLKQKADDYNSFVRLFV